MNKIDQYATSNYKYDQMNEFNALSIAYNALMTDHKKLRKQLGKLSIQLKGVKDRDQLIIQLMKANDMIIRLSEEKEKLEKNNKELIEVLHSYQGG